MVPPRLLAHDTTSPLPTAALALAARLPSSDMQPPALIPASPTRPYGTWRCKRGWGAGEGTGGGTGGGSGAGSGGCAGGGA
eukprot:CAMPEP_0174734196 /NCGR_PEP_ID=MMETSP1094-20130205/62818_1 /TAXON_ID=156173 /ORGANISM="Chrysochromulina brevifilum, Strain UTEX LB 985" /LENGTH=80 /DNA_ID=CAMNT_0015936981 /DNA_START=396 /DNA_END=635 /DNA_ORIENTATION=+